MRIEHIRIDNYRRFEHFECGFDPHFTLLMGPNGSGKTSLLKAIFGALSQLFEVKGVEDTDVRRTLSVDPGDSAWRVPVYPCRLIAGVALGAEQLVWAQEATASANSVAISSPPELSQAARNGFYRQFELKAKWLDPATDLPTPVIARFSAASSFSGSGRPSQVKQPFATKQEAWQRAVVEAVDIQGLAQWFQYNELRTLQEGKTPLAYGIAREAVLSAIHAQDIKYVVRDNELMVQHEGVGWRPWDQLSDGQKRVAAIFCELALRCATLNSHLAERCIVDSPGLVLIDELDLHLHPLWQRQVVADLRRVFPKLQFIVASHSPFLLQAAFEYGQVVDMQTGQFVAPGDPSIEDIAETVMGVPQPQRGQHFLELKRLSTEYLQKLENPPTDPAGLAKLKAELDGALAVFANDPASAAWLEQQRTAAGL